MVDEQAHQVRLREARRQPERRRADELRREVPVARRSAHRCPGAEARVGVGAVRQEHRRHLLVAAHDGLVQRGEAGLRGVRVGAAVEEERHEVGETGVRREHRRAHAPGVFVVDIRARGDQQLRRLQIADARREQQRRVAAVGDRAVVVEDAVREHGHHLAPRIGPRVDVGAAGDQHLDHRRVLLRDGPHQRRLAARRARVRGRRPSRRADRRPRRCPVRAATISGVSPARSALFGSAPACSSRRVIAALPFWAASQSGVAPRSFAALASAPARKQHVGDLQLVAVARPVERRRPVALGGLDVGFLLNEGTDRRQISVASGGDERRRLGRSNVVDAEQHGKQ